MHPAVRKTVAEWQAVGYRSAAIDLLSTARPPHPKILPDPVPTASCSACVRQYITVEGSYLGRRQRSIPNSLLSMNTPLTANGGRRSRRASSNFASRSPNR